jgi:two-component system CheB/CheR fusion protein
MVTTGASQLVVIGASAGGIEALSTVLASLPTPFRAPIVVAQHLEPTRRSHLPEIMARRTALEVRSVDAVEKLQPGVVYLVPADHDVEITDHEVRLREVSGKRRPRPSVDRLLASAAKVFGEQLIAVILTGEGSDGAEGARSVKMAGGTVMIQDPRSAAHPSMPLSLAPTTVDFTVPLEGIGPLLDDLLRDGDGDPSRMDDGTLERFLNQVRDRTGIDFATYKRPTITRRLQRRMTAVGVTGLPDYVRYVSRNPAEYDRLASSFLIKVTDFFRDPDLYEALRREVLPDIVEEASRRDHEIRIWSAGCATGEEAYSLAILMAEVLGDDLAQYSVRIFATDLDGEAIDFARRGIYTRSAIAGLSPELVERYFQPVGDDYEVSKHIRALTVFGQHDLGQRAPFPRIDLAVTRNVLIYFTAQLQKRALHLFAFSLREGGYLVLGKAESVTPLPEHFVVEDARLKIYRRHGDRVVIPPSRGAWMRDVGSLVTARPQSLRPSYAPGTDPRQTRDRPTSAEKAEQLVLHSPVGMVLVDPDYDIQLINGAARRHLRVHGTAVGQDLVHVATSIPSDVLRRGIDRSLRGDDTVSDVPTEDPTGSEPRIVRLRFAGHRSDPSLGAPDGVIVLIDDVSEGARAMADGDRRTSVAEGEVQALARRLELLTVSNEELLAANHDLALANAELRSANEELLVGSEEVQAATEEVETLNEELQATNEELETLNEELQATVEELNTTNDDLEARSAELERTTAIVGDERQRSEDHWIDLADRLTDGVVGIVVVDRRGRILVPSEVWSDLVAGDRVFMIDGAPIDGPDGVLERIAAGAVVSGTVERRLGRAVERYALRGEPLHGRASELRGGLLTIRRLRHVQGR